MSRERMYPGEHWLPIKGFEGRYSISDYGRVRSHDRVSDHGGYRPRRLKGKLLKLRANPASPYPAVQLWLNGATQSKEFAVHVLVTEYFVEPRPDWAQEVNHKDGVKKNNYFKNLEWTTYAGNSQHAYDTGLQPKRKLTKEQATEIKRLLKLEAKGTYGRLTRIARQFGITNFTVFDIEAGKSWRHA